MLTDKKKFRGYVNHKKFDKVWGKKVKGNSFIISRLKCSVPFLDVLSDFAVFWGVKTTKQITGDPQINCNEKRVLGKKCSHIFLYTLSV